MTKILYIFFRFELNYKVYDQKGDKFVNLDQDALFL